MFTSGNDVSGGLKVKNGAQGDVVLGDVHEKDVLVAGTGSGKTLPMAICIWLDDPKVNYLSITISPLKRLQASKIRLATISGGM